LSPSWPWSLNLCFSKKFSSFETSLLYCELTESLSKSDAFSFVSMCMCWLESFILMQEFLRWAFCTLYEHFYGLGFNLHKTKKGVIVLYFHLLVGYNRYWSLYCPFWLVKCASFKVKFFLTCYLCFHFLF